MARKANREQVMKEAWIGDAVLCLYARNRILHEDGVLDGAKSARMTSNQFLSIVGEPSETEAEIGRIYQHQGLDAAFQWIEQHLIPHFHRLEAKRVKKS